MPKDYNKKKKEIALMLDAAKSQIRKALMYVESSGEKVEISS